MRLPWLGLAFLCTGGLTLPVPGLGTDDLDLPLLGLTKQEAPPSLSLLLINSTS